MDALLLSLILCALAEGTGTSARRYARLRLLYGQAGAAAVSAGLAAACIVNALIAALAGHWIAPMLTPEARALFLAAALAISGGTMVLGSRSKKAPGGSAEERMAFASAAATLFIVCLSGSAPLLIAAIAVSFADPWMAGIGGAVGCVAGCVAGAMIARETGQRLAGIGFGSLLLIGAFAVAMTALRLA